MAFGCLDTKVISLLVRSLEGSRWASQDPLLLGDLNRQLRVTGGDKETPPKDSADPSAEDTPPLWGSSLVPFLSGEGRGVFEGILVFTSQEMKRRAPDCAATKKSTAAVLKHIYTPTHSQTACKNSVEGTSLGIGRTFRELPPPHSASSDHHHLTVEILLPPRLGSQMTH